MIGLHCLQAGGQAQQRNGAAGEANTGNHDECVNEHDGFSLMSMMNLTMSMLSLMMSCHKVTDCNALQPWALLEGAPESTERETFIVQQLIHSFFQSASFTASLLALALLTQLIM